MSESNAHDEFIRKYRQFNGLPDEKIIQIGDYFPVNENRYKKKKVASPKPEPKKTKKKYKGKIALVGTLAAAIAGIAGYAIGTSTQSPTITTSQAIVLLGETPKSLGINDEIASRIQKIEKELKNEDITNKDIIELIPEVHQLSYDVLQNKLARTMSVDNDSIKFGTESADEGRSRQYVNVYHGSNKAHYTHYTSKDIAFICTENTISDEIASQIKNISTSGNYIIQAQNGDINRDKMLENLNKSFDETNKFAAGDLKIDEKGNFTIDMTKVSDISKELEENGYSPRTKQKIEEYKTSDDSYSVNADGNVENTDTVNIEYDDDGR